MNKQRGFIPLINEELLNETQDKIVGGQYYQNTSGAFAEGGGISNIDISGVSDPNNLQQELNTTKLNGKALEINDLSAINNSTIPDTSISQTQLDIIRKLHTDTLKTQAVVLDHGMAPKMNFEV